MFKKAGVLLAALVLSACGDGSGKETTPPKEAAKVKQQQHKVQERKRYTEDDKFSNAYGSQRYEYLPDKAVTQIAPLPPELRVDPEAETTKQAHKELKDEIQSIKVQSTGLKQWDDDKAH